MLTTENQYWYNNKTRNRLTLTTVPTRDQTDHQRKKIHWILFLENFSIDLLSLSLLGVSVSACSFSVCPASIFLFFVLHTYESCQAYMNFGFFFFFFFPFCYRFCLWRFHVSFIPPVARATMTRPTADPQTINSIELIETTTFPQAYKMETYSIVLYLPTKVLTQLHTHTHPQPCTGEWRWWTHSTIHSLNHIFTLVEFKWIHTHPTHTPHTSPFPFSSPLSSLLSSCISLFRNGQVTCSYRERNQRQ